MFEGRGRRLMRCVAMCCAALALAVCAGFVPAGIAGASPRTPGAARSCGLAASALSRHTTARHAATGPQLVLSPAQGAAGTKIVATGSGWPQGASVTVEARAGGLAIASAPLAPVSVQSDGTFTMTLAAPDASCSFTPAVGMVVQLAATTADGTQSASASFTYDVPSPALAAPPDGGAIAATVDALPVRGSNWGAGTRVSVWATTPTTPANARDAWLPPDGVPVAVLAANASGQIAGTVPLPTALLPLRPGTRLGLAARATDAGYGDVITYLPSAYSVGLGQQPTLAASQSALGQGETLRVSGDHWWPGDTLRLLYCQGAPQPTRAPVVRCDPARSVTLGTARVDANGHFAATVIIPSNAPAGSGTLEATVSGQFDDPFTATQALRVTATFNPGAWLTSSLGPAAPLLALALLALAGMVAAVWFVAQRRGAAQAAPRG